MAHPRGKFTARTKARKRAADVLFEADQKGIIGNAHKTRELLEQRKQVSAAASPLPEYSVRIVMGVAEEQPRIQKMLAAHAKGAGLDRLPAVDLAVLRVAVWELLCNSNEVPPVTAIDEAVAIVKDLSTDSSPAYVNGVLDAVRKKLEQPWERDRAEVVPKQGSDTGDSPNEQNPEDLQYLDDYIDEY